MVLGRAHGTCPNVAFRGQGTDRGQGTGVRGQGSHGTCPNVAFPNVAFPGKSVDHHVAVHREQHIVPVRMERSGDMGQCRRSEVGAVRGRGTQLGVHTVPVRMLRSIVATTDGMGERGENLAGDWGAGCWLKPGRCRLVHRGSGALFDGSGMSWNAREGGLKRLGGAFLTPLRQ